MHGAVRKLVTRQRGTSLLVQGSRSTKDRRGWFDVCFGVQVLRNLSNFDTKVNLERWDGNESRKVPSPGSSIGLPCADEMSSKSLLRSLVLFIRIPPPLSSQTRPLSPSRSPAHHHEMFSRFLSSPFTIQSDSPPHRPPSLLASISSQLPPSPDSLTYHPQSYQIVTYLPQH